jgi:hypothetical protein
MKVSKTLRVVIGSVVLLVVAGAIWWVVGYSLGKTILAETGGGAGFRSAYGFKDSEVSAIFFLALLSLVVRQVGGDAGGRWIRLAGVAGVAAFLAGGLRGSDGLSVALFVFAAAAVAEAHAMEALLVALVGGAVVAFASSLGTGLALGHQLLVTVLRDLFLYVPLLFGPELLDGMLWKKLD